MGKNLKGKELGVGISQRKDGLYVARYTNKNGKRIQKVFQRLPECKQWLADEQYKDAHSDIDMPENLTMDAWFEYWINLKEKTLRDTTIDSYKTRYRIHIQPIIGQKLLIQINALHCQNIINEMGRKGFNNGSIISVKKLLSSILNKACDVDIINKNPCKKELELKVGKKNKKSKSMLINQQKIFCKAIIGSPYEYQYRLILQTGLRIGELTGLQWQDINFERKQLTVQRSFAFVNKHWSIHDPKTDAGFRIIPLTDEAINILKLQKNKNITPTSEWNDLVFVSKKGGPILNARYNNKLYEICEKANLPYFSVHELRHTFATRCIEAGMKPKILQKILGHSKIEMTMNLYVHGNEDQIEKEMFEVSQKLLF